MAYTVGSVSSYDGLRQFLIDACINEGWQWNDANSVLYKGAVFIRLTVNADGMAVLGRTSLTAGDAPQAVRIGILNRFTGRPTFEITWPAVCEIFAFENEVFAIINYDVDRYQFVAFGQSSMAAALPGSGAWFGASAALPVAEFSDGGPITIDSTGADSSYGISASLTGGWGASQPTRMSYWLHADLDGHGWSFAANGDTRNAIRNLPQYPLVDILPSAWNAEGVLLPVRMFKVREADFISLTAELQHVRQTRIDNYDPGQIIAIGPDRWKVYPWHKKNADARNGGINIDHTGTFGWAIRYEGP